MGLLEGELPDWVHRRAREGCRVASGVIVRRHSGFAIMVCNRVGENITSVPREDMDAMAFEGLFLAALRHDPGRGTKFCTTAGLWVEMSVRRGVASYCRWFAEPIQFLEGSHEKYLEKYKDRRNSARLAAHMDRNGLGPASGMVPMKRLRSEAAEREREIAEASLDCRWLPWGVLSPRERESVAEHYIEGLEFKDIASRHGTALSAIRQNVGRGEVKLKKAVDKKMRVKRCG
jgi:DNA-directed RNA polymerase specialized sigma subunit